MADMVAAGGQKIHETEYLVTGDKRLLHGPADERIWKGLGRYIEEMVDIQKYGLLVLMLVLLASEMTRVGLVVDDLNKQGRLGPRKGPPKEGEPEKGPKAQVK